MDKQELQREWIGEFTEKNNRPPTPEEIPSDLFEDTEDF